MQHDTASDLVDHFFRHEAGRLTAALVRRFGVDHLDEIEDAIQFAFERALGSWPRRGTPDSPAAWLTQVAKNRLLDILRRGRREVAIDALDNEESTEHSRDDLLTLLFACSDEGIAPRARLVLCLKLVCGFSTSEIAVRLFMSASNVQKTLERGRLHLQQSYARTQRRPRAADNDGDERLRTVQHVLYLVFNEGYSLGEGDTGLRVELCEEAIRLTGLLAQHSVGDRSSTWALLALMHFHSTRLAARLDDDGEFIPLREQDRSLWDGRHRQLAFACLQEATRDEEFSRFHGEAAIQAEHASATSVDATQWSEIVDLYQALEAMAPSPMYTLNRAIAQAEATNAQDGLDVLDNASLPSWFRNHHLCQATLGELHRRLGQHDDAAIHFANALHTAPSTAERRFFEKRLHECNRQVVGDSPKWSQTNLLA